MRRLLHIIRENWVAIALFLILLSISSIFLLKPFYDNDFFWHLKTGEWIWQNGRLPDHDLFNYTNPAAVTPAIRFTLTSYWLSQVMFYLAFLGSGMVGIVAMRFLITALLLFTMMRRQQGDRIINTSLLLLFCVLILNFYFIERPQSLSFLYFGILLLTLERIRSSALPGNEKTGNHGVYLHTLFLAVTMLLWSNSHGGYLLGQVILLIFMLMEGLKFFHHKLNPMVPAGYGKLLCAGIIGIVCSLINPNNYQALLLMLQSRAGDPSTQIQEYSSMLEFYSTSHTPVVILYLAIMILTGMTLLAFPKKIDITEIVLLTFLGYYAFTHVRYAAFFPIAALPVLGKRLSSVMLVRWGRWVLPPLILCIAVYAVSREFSVNIATATSGAWINDRRFPVKAADFILANNVQGTMFNQYDWGGYLIWRLAPQRRVFADGRNLNSDVLLHEYIISTAQVNYGTGEQVWKSLLQKYGVNYVLAYSRTPTGTLTPLASALLMDRDWVPVFSDRGSRSVIFVRNIPDNSSIIAQRHFQGV